ncbi:putative Helicase [Mycena venus]|uniref:Putative Helicase n=1 Tax=Mycena venus TaxID=2733690 RepID=A0A8H7CK05_9AGAR|nr:putative Helicase [Mycena venus]
MFSYNSVLVHESCFVNVNKGNGGKQQDAADVEVAFSQPALITGARLKDYELEGLQWMIGLHEQGTKGFLPTDERGPRKANVTLLVCPEMSVSRRSFHPARNLRCSRLIVSALKNLMHKRRQATVCAHDHIPSFC